MDQESRRLNSSTFRLAFRCSAPFLTSGYHQTFCASQRSPICTDCISALRHSRNGKIRSDTQTTHYLERCSISVGIEFFFGKYRLLHSLFRPEKDHIAQVKAFHRLLQSHAQYSQPGSKLVKLVLVGGSRNDGDAARVEKLRRLVKDLGIEVWTLHSTRKDADKALVLRRTLNL